MAMHHRDASNLSIVAKLLIATCIYFKCCCCFQVTRTVRRTAEPPKRQHVAPFGSSQSVVVVVVSISSSRRQRIGQFWIGTSDDDYTRGPLQENDAENNNKTDNVDEPASVTEKRKLTRQEEILAALGLAEVETEEERVRQNNK